jgi:hypothetical protein
MPFAVRCCTVQTLALHSLKCHRCLCGAYLLARAAGRALVSVSEKAGLPELAQGLQQRGYELVSTGGSAAAIEQAGALAAPPTTCLALAT